MSLPKLNRRLSLRRVEARSLFPWLRALSVVDDRLKSLEDVENAKIGREPIAEAV